MAKLDIQLIKNRFKVLFDADMFFMDKELSKERGSYVFDKKSFIAYMREHGYWGDNNYALANYVQRTYGMDASRLIQFLIANRG